MLLTCISGVLGDCKDCYSGLVECANAKKCTDTYKVTVAKMVQLIRQDCPIINGGPCPRVVCQGEVSTTCPPCERPGIKITPCPPCPSCTTTTPSPRVTCPACSTTDFDKCTASLGSCEDSLTFERTAKEGAQKTANEYKDEVSDLTREVNLVTTDRGWYKNKTSELTASLNECNYGYGLANDSVDFSVKLANELSGKLDFCYQEFNKSSLSIKNIQARLNKSIDDNSVLKKVQSSLQSDLRELRASLKNCSTFGDHCWNKVSRLGEDLDGKIFILVLIICIEIFISCYLR